MSEHNKKIRWGIIGLGKIAHKFAKDLLTIEDVELYAVASRTQDKAEAFANKYNATKAYSSYEDLANDPNIDAVYIATPHVFHKENAILCLNKGIAVLCEKPFAMNIQEVEEMIACAKENKTLLMEALCTSVLPHYQFALNALKNKTYGDILKLEADFGFKTVHSFNSRVLKKSLGGGSLLDIGIYPIFASLSTLGIPKSIEAEATFFENKVDSSCHMVFKYDHKVIANLRCSFVENTPTEAIFYCEKGVIKIDSRFCAPSTITIISNGEEDTIDFNYKTAGYDYEIKHFNQLLRAGNTQSDIMSFDFSRNLINLLDDVREIIGLKYES